MKSSVLAVGVMSGTSLDGIDIAVVELEKPTVSYLKTVATEFTPFSTEFKSHLKDLCECVEVNKERLVRTDRLIGSLIGKKVNDLLNKSGLSYQDIEVIGSHGLTIGHFPERRKMFGVETAFTCQIGDGDVIAFETKIPTVSQFRQKDMAANGEGAPLIPIIDKILFGSESENICCLNIGGISNITVLPKDNGEKIIAFDTGPGNCLSDMAIGMLYDKSLSFDKNGNKAKKGQVDKEVLARIISDNYFSKQPPKSTGKEYFGEEFLNFILSVKRDIDFKDLFTTISYLTPFSIAKALKDFIPSDFYPEKLIVSGGGVLNGFFMEQLKVLLPNCEICTSDIFGISSQFKEAIGFAMLGYMNLQKVKGSIPSVTGAGSCQVLGKLSV
jgi:anhydro-N-acetylmuramic acid kinase